ncbi:MAG TPA: uroporphyrinogen-III synthase [Pseudomonadales bacterium]|nr:uroporphyrinogen-III synthase [Pseudomonadales bacterium]
MGQLEGLQVVVTRPAPSAETLVQRFGSCGADAVAIPLLAIETLVEPTSCDRIERLLDDLPACDFAIFISQHAAEQAMLALQVRKQAWPSQVKAFAVGKSTGACLQQHGIATAVPEQMDSEGLLALPGLQAVNGQRGIIFRGVGGRETLAQALRGRGATVDYCELYQRTLPVEAAQQWRQWDSDQQAAEKLVCINSVETLDNLLAIMQHAVDCQPTNRDNLTLLVPGERVARAASQRGFSHVVVAQDALDDTVIAAAIHWYTNRTGR